MMNRKMIKQAQELQKNMARMQEELEASTVEGTSGGGVVKAVVNGKMTLESLVIDPDAVSAINHKISSLQSIFSFSEIIFSLFTTSAFETFLKSNL